MEANNQITLVQQPVIKHALQRAGQQVTERLAELNIANLIANEDTYKALKTLRADLNKELDDYEAQRKFIKDGILNPYNEFEGVYKEQISEKYKAAITALKDKIANVEDKLKGEKEASLRDYFTEYTTAENINFVPFEALNLNINLTVTEKKLREEINVFIARIKDELALIATHPHQAEVLVEYKKTLNAARAITEITERKERERLEQERIQRERTDKRRKELITLGFATDTMTATMIFNDAIWMTDKDIAEMQQSDWATAIEKYKKQIDAEKAQAAIQAPAPEQGEIFHQPAPTPAPAPIQAPIEQIAPEVFTASFTVRGTMQQLRALGQYMKDNNINYQNI